MASERQIEANRRNAKHSTGPKTDQGKVRSSQNARRHGLSRPRPHDHAGYEMLTRVVRDWVVQPAPSIEPIDIVSAKLELARVREVRHALLAAFLTAPTAKLAKPLRNLARYERAAFARQRRVMRGAADQDGERTFDTTKPIRQRRAQAGGGQAVRR